MGTPPPSTLTMPVLGTEYDGEVFLAVVQTERDCPVGDVFFHIPYIHLTISTQPDGHIEYGLASNGLIYSQ